MEAGRRTAHPLRAGLKLSVGAPIETFRRVWRIADEVGVDHCHLVAVDDNGAPSTLFGGWTLLAAMAEATTRTRIGLLVGGMAYRHQALLAKASVTVDHLSAGRLELGIGAGWTPCEQVMYGVDVGRPAVRVEKGLDVMKLLWSGGPASHHGRHFTQTEAVASPPSVLNA